MWKCSIKHTQLHMASHCTKFQVSRFSHSKAILEAKKIKIGHMAWQCFLGTICLLICFYQPAHQIWSLYVRPQWRYGTKCKMLKLGWFRMGHRKSSETWPFDGVHMTSDSTIKETVSILYSFKVLVSLLATCHPSGCTVVSGVTVGVCNNSQMRTSKCTFNFWCEYRSWSWLEMHKRNFW